MSVEGNLDLFQLPEILQLIGQQQKTGILTVQGEEDIVAISFLHGKIVAADSLNQAVEEAWPLLGSMQPSVYLIHQTGNSDYRAVLTRFRAARVAGQLLPFISGMPEAFSQADVVVCRAGAGTVSELAAAGKPSILVPFQFAAGDHQMRNARALEKAGAAVVVRDQEMSGARLARELARLDETTLASMGRAARTFARPGAALRAAETLEELARNPV